MMINSLNCHNVSLITFGKSLKIKQASRFEMVDLSQQKPCWHEDTTEPIERIRRLERNDSNNLV